MRGRPVRAVLSGLGIALGIACVVAVLGVSASSQARLLARIDALGTNLLTVQPGRTVTGDQTGLPITAPAMISALPGVREVAYVGAVDGAIYRNDHIAAAATGGLTVRATSLNLPDTLALTITSGTWLNPATERHPATVLGSVAARRLGVAEARDGPQVYLAGQWFTVVGVLAPSVLDPALDASALVGFPVAVERLGSQGQPTKIYERSDDAAVTTLVRQLPPTADPAEPSTVTVSRPSDALTAKAAAQSVHTNLFIGLGAVALIVGSVGIANVMVIGVLERRGEIGLRRALGATRRHVRTQFLTESVLMSLAGGLAGALLGAAATAGYAEYRAWPLVVPGSAVTGSLAASLLAGTVAGIYPAVRAARMSPTEALRAV
ncbi:ABC transporter permease [Embleya sp. NPDC059259]|uniref:ABC transporter permease n=1 Tax=unclassified Embleya TaxID=2699296 RepID=UPI0036C6BE7D